MPAVGAPVTLFVQHPLNTFTFFLKNCCCLCGSIRENIIGADGGKAFAEALPKSSLTSLKCATAHVLANCVSTP